MAVVAVQGSKPVNVGPERDRRAISLFSDPDEESQQAPTDQEDGHEEYAHRKP
jgi:hypothetical protein